MDSNENTTKRVFDGVEVDMKNRAVAAFLAYLLPGAGHYYQGRKAKAILFATCILGLFLTGFIIGRGRVVYAYPNTFKVTNLFRPSLCRNPRLSHDPSVADRTTTDRSAVPLGVHGSATERLSR